MAGRDDEQGDSASFFSTCDNFIIIQLQYPSRQCLGVRQLEGAQHLVDPGHQASAYSHHAHIYTFLISISFGDAFTVSKVMGLGSSSGNQTRREFYFVHVFLLLLATLLSQMGVMGD